MLEIGDRVSGAIAIRSEINGKQLVKCIDSRDDSNRMTISGKWVRRLRNSTKSLCRPPKRVLCAQMTNDTLDRQLIVVVGVPLRHLCSIGKHSVGLLLLGPKLATRCFLLHFPLLFHSTKVGMSVNAIASACIPHAKIGTRRLAPKITYSSLSTPHLRNSIAA